MNAPEIIEAVESSVSAKQSPDYSSWTIGVTTNPDNRKQAFASNGQNLQNWLIWQADDEDVAQSVEDHFLDKGMKGEITDDIGAPAYVYIF